MNAFAEFPPAPTLRRTPSGLFSDPLRSVAGLLWVAGFLSVAAANADPAIAATNTVNLAELPSAAPVREQPILFVVRHQYAPDHHNTATFFPKAKTEYNDGSFTPGGALKVLDLAQGGRVKTLIEVPEGVVRDPEVHFDGRRIVFSMRRNAADSYHLYEINADGSGLRQLTFAEEVDDLDPLYLPDDRIVFASTREPKYCMCNRHLTANLYRMDSDGANIHQIGKSTLFEGHPALLPDGRILYDRWEYVDRNFGDAQGLWSVNPDGTGHAVYWGNNTPSPGAVIDARSVPGTALTVCVFGSCHDRPWGALALVDRSLGLDGRAPVVRTWPASAIELVKDTGWEVFDAFTAVPLKYEDPYPLDDRFVLAARMLKQNGPTGIFLLDTQGDDVLLHSEDPGCFDPMPLAPRPRPPVIPERRDFANGEGVFYVADVYEGATMRGVPRGTVKSLRVVESPEKRSWTIPSWGGQGQEAPAMNWHDFNNKRILGTVPVEADGSACFSVPADTFVYFQLLDERGLLVQSMRSGALVQSGEYAGCAGCHDNRLAAPPARLAAPLQALRRPPQRLEGWHGPPRLFNYLAEVQPVFDRHCVRCHDFDQVGESKVILAGDRDLVFNASYNELWRKKLIHAIGAGPAEIQSARAWGSSRSRLLEFLDSRHYEVALSPEEFDRLVTWIDLNAPYYPSYASAYPTHPTGRSPLSDPETARLEELTGIKLRALASFRDNQGPQISFDRPEQSPCLGGIRDTQPDAFREALALIDQGRQRLAERPEADQPGFVASAIDRWRDENYAARQDAERRHRTAIRDGQKVYDR
ncbi:MAG: HzsA-related protein [Limisphaerales bacterium]